MEATENKYINKHTPTSLLFFSAAAQKKKKRGQGQAGEEVLVKDDGKSSPMWE